MTWEPVFLDAHQGEVFAKPGTGPKGYPALVLDLTGVQPALCSLPIYAVEALRDACEAAIKEYRDFEPLTDDENGRCGRIMIGSGEDSWDPTCDLAPGHSGSCKAYSATDQHRLVKVPADEEKRGS